MKKRSFSATVTKQNRWYIARCHELNVTSQGKNRESAQSDLAEAIEPYLET
jgi:predicted RNase H-like HicB family nuclease